MERRKIRFNLEEVEEIPIGGETLWAEVLPGNLFRLLNIPFHAFGYAEGDIVRCKRDQWDEWDEVVGVEQDSGNGTIRIMFVDAETPDAKEVIKELDSVGVTHERAWEHLIAFTVPPKMEVPFSQLSNYLNGLPKTVLAGWEVGKWPSTIH